MVKKAKAKIAKRAKAKKGNKYICNECGVVLSVDSPCSCDTCDPICCGEAMQLITC